MSFEKLNALGKERKPFLFISDFKAENIEVFELDTLCENDIEYSFNASYQYKKHPYSLAKQPIEFQDYKNKFTQIIQKIQSGETYILNLTQATKIETHLGLQEIYSLANAPYKLRFGDNFVCFSPERFISIEDEKIHTYPMKGTIDASIDNAEAKILANQKEMAEHIMIVDLLRNDLSIVSKDVKVEKFRYITKIDAGEKKLLQVSSHISGKLQEDWHEEIGTILQKLLPAGSISGAPKKSTLEIIENTEEYQRGFFSGVFGIYDGLSLQSAVMIRFIEKTQEGYLYKSGGGITLDSEAMSEFEEMLDKVYLP